MSSYNDGRRKLLANLIPGDQHSEKAFATARRESKIRELAHSIAHRSAELNRRLRDR